MAIELSEDSVSARKIMVGDDTFTVSAGKSLKVETSPAGEDLLDEECPAGKSWECTIFVRITETDA